MTYSSGGSVSVTLKVYWVFFTHGICNIDVVIFLLKWRLFIIQTEATFTWMFVVYWDVTWQNIYGKRHNIKVTDGVNALLEEAVFTWAVLLCLGGLTEVECVHGSRLWDVDQPGVLLPQDAVVPQTGHPDRHQEQSCRETTNQRALTNLRKESESTVCFPFLSFIHFLGALSKMTEQLGKRSKL